MKAFKDWLFVVFATLFLVILSGCGGGGGGGGDVNPPLPVVSDIFINNHSDDYLIGVYIVPSSSTDWGSNLLSAPINPWETGVFTIACNQSVDMKIEMDESSIDYEDWEIYDQYIECGYDYEQNMEWAISSAQDSMVAVSSSIKLRR